MVVGDQRCRDGLALLGGANQRADTPWLVHRGPGQTRGGVGLGQPLGRHDEAAKHPRVTPHAIAAELVGHDVERQSGGWKQARVVDESGRAQRSRRPSRETKQGGLGPQREVRVGRWVGFGQAMRGGWPRSGAGGLTSSDAIGCVRARGVSRSPLVVHAQTRPRRPVSPPRSAPAPFTTSLTLAEMTNKQAVVETALGTFVIQLLPDVAPNHVGYFIVQARKGAYDKTTFHRAVPMGIVQGGDPLSTDPAKRAMYGTGGLGILKAEFNREPVTRGAVAAVLQPDKPDSAGSQFFVAVTDQVALNGQFTVFGRVVEGLEVVQAISELPVDAESKLTERVEMRTVTIRDTPPPAPVPFSTETVEELAKYRAVLETTEGAITIAFDPVKAPEHVRNFLRLASAGVYDGTSVHRIVKGFVIQTGLVTTRATPLTQKQMSYVTTLQPEFNDTPHVAGIVSMARTTDPASASTSFFICTGPAPSLDNAYSVFGRVTSGMGVVQTIEAKQVSGETPIERVDLIRVRVEKQK